MQNCFRSGLQQWLLCSDHFEKDCFRKTGRNACTLTLENNAIPIIFKLPLIDKIPAGEHNRNSQLPVSQMETDPSLSPVEVSAAYEGREKRRLSVDLPPPKMSKTDTKYSITIPYSSFQIVPTLIKL